MTKHFVKSDPKRIARAAAKLIEACPTVQAQVWHKAALAGDLYFSEGSGGKPFPKGVNNILGASFDTLMDVLADWEGYPVASTRFGCTEVVLSALVAANDEMIADLKAVSA